MASAGRKFFVGGNWKCNGSVAQVDVSPAFAFVRLDLMVRSLRNMMVVGLWWERLVGSMCREGQEEGGEAQYGGG